MMMTMWSMGLQVVAGGWGSAGGRAQHDQPIDQGEVHRPDDRQGVDGEDQPPDRHTRQQPEALSAIRPGEPIVRCRAAGLIHTGRVHPHARDQPGPKVPNRAPHTRASAGPGVARQRGLLSDYRSSRTLIPNWRSSAEIVA